MKFINTIKNYKKTFVFSTILVGIAGYFTFEHFAMKWNFWQYDYMLSYGKYYDLDTDKKIINQRDLINVKMRAKEKDILKAFTKFEFLNKQNKKILEIDVYNKNFENMIPIKDFDIYDGYHYHLKPEYLNTPRKYDSYLKYFCDGTFETCYFTFSFLTTEPKVDFLKDVDSYWIDGKKVDFERKIYSYENEQESLDEINNINFTFNDNKIEICSKYDAFYFRETLRITTTENGNTEQVVCVKEETPNACCTLQTDTSKFSDISILHWKGNLNAGHFKEFSIKLK